MLIKFNNYLIHCGKAQNHFIGLVEIMTRNQSQIYFYDSHDKYIITHILLTENYLLGLYVFNYKHSIITEMYSVDKKYKNLISLFYERLPKNYAYKI